ncbi:MAG: hypothetical protein HY813_00900 [Candidatus Portnoybacteria bacterium]|nr:hypothetical protein [Candidatus Portnoybacteria bacterium]
MNLNLLQLKKKFGKYGSWALWDEDGSIASLVRKNDFELLLKPNIVFIGLNASTKLSEDWINYHSECCKSGKIKSWRWSHVSKLAEILREKEFEALKGAYMTDIIKNHYDSNSNVVVNQIKQDRSLVSKNIRLFEKELKMLSKISGLDKFYIVCIGNKSFEILDRVLGTKVSKIWHYSAYQLGREGVKEKIRQDLRGVIKNMKE